MKQKLHVHVDLLRPTIALVMWETLQLSKQRHPREEVIPLNGIKGRAAISNGEINLTGEYTGRKTLERSNLSVAICITIRLLLYKQPQGSR